MIKYCLVLFLSMMAMIESKVIYIVPIPGMPHETLFYQPYSSRDEVAKPFCILRERLEEEGHEVRYTYGGEGTEHADVVISFCCLNKSLMEKLNKLPKSKCWLVNLEPPVTSPTYYDKNLENIFGKIFTMFDNDVDNKTYFKIFYPQPRLEMIEDISDFSEKKLCALICTNNMFSHPKCIYRYRRSIISFFEQREQSDEFGLYGRHWDGYQTWRGAPSSKWDTLKDYKFSFCYENMGEQNGYITEKIFDSFIGGCVPVYLGADNITDYVPKECFVDRRDFESDHELYAFLKNMNRETYEEYITEIRKFLASPKAKLFSSENFSQIIIDNLLYELDLEKT